MFKYWGRVRIKLFFFLFHDNYNIVLREKCKADHYFFFFICVSDKLFVLMRVSIFSFLLLFLLMTFLMCCDYQQLKKRREQKSLRKCLDQR